MFPLASTRTRAKSCAIIAALGEICGLANFNWRNPRAHLGGEEVFVSHDFAELSSWREYRMKVAVAHPEVNNALSEASAFVRLSSTTK